jgi:hypothetical protein
MRSILLLSLLTCGFFLKVSSQILNGSASTVAVPDVITIPVVVHIIYNNADQNISNDQVRSQIKVLNEDFRKKNKDAAFIPSAFKDLAADARIEFRLATIDPSGFTTNGIVRKSTAITGFTQDDKIKSDAQGGDDPWNRNQYLNLWVGNLSGGVMGYSSIPGGAAEKDGVVISYKAFGTTPNVLAPFNKGRTTVHEIGHWLGLRHIWGDADCGDDRIDDTPPQAGPTRGCPSGVIATCSSGAAGNMYMNFMDFTNDECTNMFTLGQANRMREVFGAGGARASLLASDKARGAEEDLYEEAIAKTELYPNPAIDFIKLTMTGNAVNKIIIYNNLGQVSKQIIVTKNQLDINVKDLKSGMYFISLGGKEVLKFVKN